MHCNLDREDEVYTSGEKLDELYEQLEDSGFLYAHNSYLVNIQHVIAVGTKELQMDNGMKLTIARSKAKKFQEVFVKNVSKKYR